MGPTWGPPWSCRPQVGPILAPWTLLSGLALYRRKTITGLVYQPIYASLCFMMRSANGNISSLLALCAGNSPVTGEFPSQRPMMQRFDVFFDLRLNKQLSKQSWGWWLKMPSCSLWRQCKVQREPTQNGQHSADDIHNRISWNEN